MPLIIGAFVLKRSQTRAERVAMWRILAVRRGEMASVDVNQLRYALKRETPLTIKLMSGVIGELLGLACMPSLRAAFEVKAHLTE